MPEITIKYKNSKTLQVLKDIAKYFDFVISAPKNKYENTTVNGVTIVPANNSIEILGLKKVFTGKKISSKELRNEAWQRKK